MKEKILDCIQCGGEFVFTVAEQKRVFAKGFDEPKRCPQCRKKKEKSQGTNETWKEKGRKRQNGRKRHNIESAEFEIFR